MFKKINNKVSESNYSLYEYAKQSANLVTECDDLLKKYMGSWLVYQKQMILPQYLLTSSESCNCCCFAERYSEYKEQSIKWLCSKHTWLWLCYDLTTCYVRQHLYGAVMTLLDQYNRKTRQVFFMSRIKAVAFKAKHRLRTITINLIFKPP